MGPALSRTPVVTSGAVSPIPVAKPAGRKTKSTTGKPKHDKTLKVTVETLSSGDEESGEEMANGDAQQAAAAEAGGAQAVGFTGAGATATPP